MLDDQRIAVTGLGCLSPVGNDPDSAFDALVAGRTGIREAPFEVDPGCRARLVGAVRDFDADRLLGARASRRIARFGQLALVAARQALADAGAGHDAYPAERRGVVVGVGFGGLDVLSSAVLARRDRGLRYVQPFTVPAMLPSAAAGAISILAGANGPSFCVASACASGAHAVAEAAKLLRCGDADVVIAGGAEAVLGADGLGSFDRMGALSTGLSGCGEGCRPFDRRRDGFVMAEGAAMLVLERAAGARARGARVYAELAGCGVTSDAVHPVRPCRSGRGAANAMRLALASACVDPQDVGYINAHGTGTVENDATETHAIRLVFGGDADRLPVSSTKGATGHMLGAAGAFEALVLALCIYRGVCPPTINLECPDPACDLDYIANGAREVRLLAGLTNSFGFGGHNVTLVMRNQTF